MSTDSAHLESFKAYDIRGRIPDQLNEEMAEIIGAAYAEFVHPSKVVVGHDMRLSSPSLAQAVSKGIRAAGTDVVDIGQVGTEEVYFATFALNLDGGVMVTASHNPKDYNGMKFTRDLARPISADTGLMDIERLTLQAMSEAASRESDAGTRPVRSRGKLETIDNRSRYVEHLLTYIDMAKLKPLKIVANSGNGCSGPVLDLLEKHLPFEFVKLNHDPDGSFPHGVPNPLLPENRAATSEAVRAEKADLGLAWDGDFDRCFFFDENGEFVDGYYLVGLLAQRALRRHPGAKIIHDPRLIWNTVEIVEEAGGTPVQSKSGHAFIKEKMRAVDAAYGGEMSAHQYFKEFSYCDSGMIPWLQITETMCTTGRPLSAMVSERIARYPVSGEINLTLKDPGAALAAIGKAYGGGALSIDEMDGLSIEYPKWRFNVRPSNTEPVIRLNVETRADAGLLHEKTQEVLDILKSSGGGGS
ncbi:MAG: phosphomannomutase [Actinobacteria bacterium]|nr:phosphomannomutase [Actinomycetota bacterium]